MFKWFNNLFKKKEKIQEPQRTHCDGEQLTVWEEHWIIDNNMCPDCTGRLLEGPSGGFGLAVNIKCEDCGAKFNFAPPFKTERISDSFKFPPKKGEKSEDGHVRFNNTGANYEKISY